MNLKISSSLLALGAFTSAILLNLTPVSAQTGSGSNSPVPFVIVKPAPIPAIPITGGGSGSNTGNNVQFAATQISAQTIAAVNTALSQILAANPSALASATSGLVPPGASASLVAAAENLKQLVAGFSAGNVTAAQLNAAIAAYNTYVEALVSSLGGDGAVAFLSTSGADKALDSNNTPGIRGLLLALSARANS